MEQLGRGKKHKLSAAFVRPDMLNESQLIKRNNSSVSAFILSIDVVLVELGHVGGQGSGNIYRCMYSGHNNDV